MNTTNNLKELLNIDFPIIMAPMFLVSNMEMMKAGIRAGVMATFPTLNYRKEGELEAILDELNAYSKNYKGSYGVNIIVQKSNPLSIKHTQICLNKQVPFFITSLGSPKDVIEGAHKYGGKVFCDVTNVTHAKKCADLKCDGFIAVGQGAGGHAGPNPLQVLIPTLNAHFPTTPVVAAGGIANGSGIHSLQILGACGVSIGTRFIASTEASVNDSYKNAIVNSSMDDIVMTTKLSGTPCTIINNDAAKKMGYTQNWFEKLLSNNSQTKKWFKMLVQLRGMKKLEKSVLPNNYQTLWTAGKSAELVHDILPCEVIIKNLINEYQISLKNTQSIF